MPRSSTEATRKMGLLFTKKKGVKDRVLGVNQELGLGHVKS